MHDGADCADAYPVSFFNTSGNWGTGSTQIGPGTTVNLCGPISTNLTFYGSGTSGNPITLYFQPSASVSMAVCPEDDTGCINTNSNNYLVINGGTPIADNALIPQGTDECDNAGGCDGPIADGSDGCSSVDGCSQNGIIEATSNGSGLATQTYNTTGIQATNCSNCTIENLNIANLYQHTSVNDTSASGDTDRGIAYSGSNLTIADNTIHDVTWALPSAWNSNDSNDSIYGNNIYNIDHGISSGSLAAGGNIGPIYIHNNNVHDYANWDTGQADSFHHDGMHCFTSGDAGGAAAHYNGLYIYDNDFQGDIGANMTSQVFIEGTAESTPCADASSPIWILNNYITSTNNSVPADSLVFDSSGSLHMYNNTLVGSSTTATNPGDGQNTSCVFMGDNDSGSTYSFENNTMSTCNYLVSSISASYTSGSPNYNLYANGGDNAFHCNNEPSNTNFSAWKSCVGGDGNSQFVDSADLGPTGIPQTGSLAIKAGTDLTNVCNNSGLPTQVSTACKEDINGNARSTTWDAGAFQTGSGSGSNPAALYISNSGSGNQNGADCADAYPSSFFNNANNWGTSANQIGPGTTVNLCGTISSTLTFNGSGTSANPITLYFQPQATISEAVCPSDGCLNTGGKSYLVIDGGSNGSVQATANGSPVDTTHGFSGQTFSQQVSSSAGVNASSCSNCTIENLTVENMYQHTDYYDQTIDATENFGIEFSGSNLTIEHNTLHDIGWAIFGNYNNGDSNIHINNNDIYNVAHGFASAPNFSGGNIGPVYFNNNTDVNYANWDTPEAAGLNQYHLAGLHCYTGGGGNDLPAHYNDFYIYNNTFGGQTEPPASDNENGTSFDTDLFIEGGSGTGATPCADSTSPIYIYNNLLTASAGTLTANGDMSVNTGDVSVLNNTMVGSGTTNPDGICFNTNTTGFTNLTFKNNLMTNCNQLIYSRPGTGYASGSPDYNLYAGSEANGQTFDYGSNFISFNQFSSWQNAINGDAHSNTVADAKINTAGVPQSGSPAIGNGADLTSLCSGDLTSLCSDIEGNARTTSWDIGAFETTGVSGPAPTVNLSANPTSVTSGNISTLSWTSSNATSCEAITPTNWTNSSASSGSQAVSPTSTTTYSISCTGAGGTTDASATVTVSAPACTTGTLSSPTGIHETSNTYTSIDLAWTAPSPTPGCTITGYKIFRNSSQIGTSTNPSYNDSGSPNLNASTSYNYAIEAKDSGSNTSALSSISSLSTAADNEGPSMPSLSSNYTATASSVSLNWTAVSDEPNPGGVGVSCYYIYDSTGSNYALATTYVSAAAAGTPLSDTINSLSAGTTYHFYIEAYDAITPSPNLSAPSNIISASTSAPTCTDNPSEPSSLSPGTTTVNSVSFSWHASSASSGCTMSGYNIYQVNGSAYNQVAQVTNSGSGTISTTISALTPNSSYVYAIEGYDSSGHTSDGGTHSNLPTIDISTNPDTSPPTSPSSLSADATGSNQVSLSWPNDSTDNVAVTGYNIYRSDHPTQVLTTLNVGSCTTTCTYLDNSVVPNTSYSYQVAAIDGAGNISTPKTSSGTVTTPSGNGSAPGNPSGLSAGVIATQSASLSWNAPSSGGSPSGYHVYINGVLDTYDATPTSPSVTLACLAPSTSYTITVSAYNGAGVSSKISTNLTTTSGGKKGDFRCNGSVGITDLSILATNWNLTGSALPTQGDTNGDTNVNILDLSALASNWL